VCTPSQSLFRGVPEVTSHARHDAPLNKINRQLARLYAVARLRHLGFAQNPRRTCHWAEVCRNRSRQRIPLCRRDTRSPAARIRTLARIPPSSCQTGKGCPLPQQRPAKRAGSAHLYRRGARALLRVHKRCRRSLRATESAGLPETACGPRGRAGRGRTHRRSSLRHPNLSSLRKSPEKLQMR